MSILRAFWLVLVLLCAASAEVAPTNATEASGRVVIPRVVFMESSFTEAMDYLQVVSRKAAPKSERLNVIVAVPEKQRPAITLDRRNATFLALVQEVAAAAGCEVQGEAHALVIREKGAAPLPAIILGKGGNAEAVQKKLAAIVFPRVDFRESTQRESIEFIVQKTKQLDPDGAGVSMVLKLDDQGAPGANSAPPPKVAAIPGLPGLPGNAAVPVVEQEPRINLQASHIPLPELLRYVAGIADLQVTIEPFAIVIAPVAKK